MPRKPKLTAKDKRTMKQIAAGMSKRRKPKAQHKITVVTGGGCSGGAGGSRRTTAPSVDDLLQGYQIPVPMSAGFDRSKLVSNMTITGKDRGNTYGGAGGGGGTEPVYGSDKDGHLDIQGRPGNIIKLPPPAGRHIIVIWPWTLIAGLLIGFVCGSFAGISWQDSLAVTPPPAKHRCSDYAGWYWSSEQGKCVRDEP